jgi:type IV secretory pathway VirB10-like protein
MADKRKDSDFKVSDRRLFTADGELRSSGEDQAEEPKQPEQPTSAAAPPPVAAAPAATAKTAVVAPGPEAAAPPPPDADTPEPPTASEQQAQHDAYRQSARDLDRRVELSGHSSKELEVSFERFMASLYMTAMVQLGLMHEQGGQPGVDLIGARQTIDTLGMLAEKTKGNLTPKEQGFLQNCLYELRMAYVEVTNALARAPQAPGPSTGANG